LTRSTAIAIVIVTAIAIPAHAQVSSTAEETAFALNRRSHELYEQGRYAEAATLLREAYRLKPVPILQYNLARACERMADHECAIAAYESYLPDAPSDERAAIEARLVRYRQRLAGDRTPAAPAPPPAVAADRSSHSLMPPIVAVIGTVGLGVGGVVAYKARKDNDAAIRDPSLLAGAKKANAESLMLVANTTMVAGSLVALAGVAWWILDRRAPHSAPAGAQLRIGPGTIAVIAAF
jgi:tetratricopeptide (TPR) repeat protein